MRTLIRRRHVLGVLAVAALFIASFLPQGSIASAAEVKVLSAPAMRGAMNELGLPFERATGHKLVIQYGLAPWFRQRIDAGETFDVAIFTPAVIDDLTKQGKIAVGTRANIARSGLGVAVRTGAPKPDISSIDAFKRMLLNAKSVAYTGEGTSGTYFLGLLERLGIAAEMKAKLKPMAAGAVGQSVVTGEAEISVIPIPSILVVPGAELVGPLPSELQTYIEFIAVVRMGAKETEAASALLKFLTTPEAAAVLKAKGMEPG